MNSTPNKHTNTKTCPKCHVSIGNDFRFCSQCGTSLSVPSNDNNIKQPLVTSGGEYGAREESHVVQPIGAPIHGTV